MLQLGWKIVRCINAFVLQLRACDNPEMQSAGEQTGSLCLNNDIGNRHVVETLTINNNIADRNCRL